MRAQISREILSRLWEGYSVSYPSWNQEDLTLSLQAMSGLAWEIYRGFSVIRFGKVWPRLDNLVWTRI